MIAVERVLVITAPSGAGKTTLNRRLVKEHPQLAISISLTTRPARKKERHGDHYWFVSRQEFASQRDRGRLLEWAEVFGNLYGTSLDEVERIQQANKRPILEIDVKGWEQVRTKLPEALAIFILPPSMGVLWQRLEQRGTDTLAKRRQRFQTARAELDQGHNYQYFVVNDDLECAYGELQRIIHGEPAGLPHAQGVQMCRSLIAEGEKIWQEQLATGSSPAAEDS